VDPKEKQPDNTKPQQEDTLEPQHHHHHDDEDDDCTSPRPCCH
jgi:hypothetical protein